MAKKIPFIGATSPTRPRNAFDLSQKHLFTAPVGALLPILSVDLMPHDHIEINASDFMRTLPMNSAAFMSMRGVYEFYFVPYSQLWHQFDQFITGMRDFSSSLLSDSYKKAPMQLPTYRISDIVTELNKRSKDKTKYKDIFGFSEVKNAYRLLDLLGYGKFANSSGIGYFDDFFKWFEKAKTDQALLQSLPNELRNRILGGGFSFSNADSVSRYLINKYLEELERKTKEVNSSLDSTKKDLEKAMNYFNNSLSYSVTPFRIAAYQKIYNDYYRNTIYEPTEIYSANFDNINFESGTIGGDLFVDRFLKLRYRSATLDYFTNLRPQPLFGDDMFNPEFFQGRNNGTSDYKLHPDYNSVQVGFASVANIRNAFAMDKLLSITARAGKTYAEQIKAHFGVNVSEGRDGRCQYLGGFDSNVQVGDVTQTAGTSATGSAETAQFGGYLGRVTGKATASGQGHISFDAKEHGVLMCIYSLVPSVSYDSTKVDPFLTKTTRGDFFIPEFENLGMQPLESKYVNFLAKNVTGDTQTQRYVLGWQPRYSEYKTALDVNHGQFNDGEPLSYWTISRAKQNNTLDTFNIASLKLSPRLVDSVFALDYNGSELTDCVFGGCYFSIQKVSDMSEDGMPKI